MGRRLALLALLIGASLGAYLAFRGVPEEVPDDPHEKRLPDAHVSASSSAIADTDLIGGELGEALTFASNHPFPDSFPWRPLRDLCQRHESALEELRRTKPLTFLEMCLARQRREVHSYKLRFLRKERIHGKLYPPEKDMYEIVDVAFREEPFSVFFKWMSKGKLAAKVLYVEGENDNKMLARPFLTVLPIMTEDVDGPKAKNSGRYTIAEFGLYKATERSIASMKKAQANGTLHMRYEGKVALAEVGDRTCYKFVRTPYEPLEEDALYELTLYFDCQTWLQVGSILRDPKGQLLAEYFFRDIQINPEFDGKQFTRAAL
jgi:hypothetical protein